MVWRLAAGVLVLALVSIGSFRLGNCYGHKEGRSEFAQEIKQETGISAEKWKEAGQKVKQAIKKQGEKNGM